MTYPFIDLDADLLAAFADDSRARMCVRRPAQTMVVLGRGSRPEQELQLSACEQDGVPIFRRRGGGCAVVLDEGNLVVSFVRSAPGFGDHQRLFDQLSAWLIDGLRQAGIAGIKQTGFSDLVWEGRKVAGACLHRSGALLYYSASLLVRPDLAIIERYLKHPPREPEYRQGRSHREFLAALGTGLWSGGVEELRCRLERCLALP